MRKLIAALLLVLFAAATPATAAPLSSEQAKELAAKHDFHGIVVVMEGPDWDGVAGYWMGIVPYIGVQQPSNGTELTGKFILYHEIAHHKQWLSTRYYPDPFDEWEADVWAIKRMCDEGDGPHAAWALLQYYADRVRPDVPHGDPWKRWAYARDNTASYCGVFAGASLFAVEGP